MKIINPLYDNAFKYLMDNEQIARKVLSIILNQEVLSLQSKPQETIIYADQRTDTARYDFKAIIRNANNEETCVLIELQKYNNPNPIVRFREYLSQNYSKEETFINAEGKEEKQSLPIIAIYILGYKVTKAEILALKVERNIVDIIWDTPVDELPEFVELLTHTSVIIQVNAKPKELKNTRLEKFINLFTQKIKNEEPNYIIELAQSTQAEMDTDIHEIVNYLQNATLNEKVIRSLKYEASYEKGLKDVEETLKRAQAQAEQERKEKEQAQAIAEQAQAKAEQAQAKAEQAQAKAEQAQAKAEQILKNSILAMHKAGMDKELIASLLQIPVELVIHNL